MLSNISEFVVLIERYDDEPGVCSKLLRKHSENNPEAFLNHAKQALLKRPVSRALKFVVALAVPIGLIETLLALYPRSQKSALAVARKVLACESRFDYMLFDFLQQSRLADTAEGEMFHIGLEILNHISPGDRMTPYVLRMLRHSNPTVRSKAARFVGSRTRNHAWVNKCTQDYDPRVRANLIESLYGLDAEFVAQVFWNNVEDENNRAAGNAMLGLYLLGEPAAISLIDGMGKHPDARFRNTAAWLMGKTGDPCFALALAELMRDPAELVRVQAFKGLGALKKAQRDPVSRPVFAAQPIPATARVKARTVTKPVRSYDVHDGRDFTLANISEFEVLLECYDGDPGICSKLLRKHSLQHPKTFLEYSQEALLERPVSRALKFVVRLGIATGLIESLLDLYPRSSEKALAIARKVEACDPRFDYILVEFLQQPRPADIGEIKIFHAGLEILDGISLGERMVPYVLRMLRHHPNPKVRSKAARFVGSRTQNRAWITNNTQDYDPRVRANIIESLYKSKSDFATQMFWENVADKNNRVAGNAVLGLYLTGQSASIPLIDKMRKHPQMPFRNTAAWLMGKTGDARFAGTLSELINDPEELVRKQAFKGLGEIKKATRAYAGRPPLQAALLKVELGDSPSLIASVRDLAGQPVRGIKPTKFIVKIGTPAKPVCSYHVEEHDCSTPLNVAFVMCLPGENEAEAEAQFTQAIKVCQGLRRPKDRWGIVKIGSQQALPEPGLLTTEASPRFRQKWAILNVNDYAPDGPKPNTRPPAAPRQKVYRGFEYSNHQTAIDTMLGENPVPLGESESEETIRTVLHCLLSVEDGGSNPHIIFFGDGSAKHLLSALAAKGPQLAAAVHVLAHSAAWDAEDVRQIVSATGGLYRSVFDDNTLPELCAGTYSFLLHHYRIRWAGPTENLELEINAESGRVSIGYEAGVHGIAESA